jgi:FkbM family methyltransferase
MSFPHRPIAFMLAASNHGTMIVNRNDHHGRGPGSGFGVGHQIMENACFDASEVNFALALLTLRRRYFGDGVFAIDGGANIGVHSVEWARHMHGWGRVLAFEAQEIVYYALAGNLVLNNCLNARARCAALGEHAGELTVPQPDYFSPASFGSLELRERDTTEFIGQPVSYAPSAGVKVPMVSIDSLDCGRVDFIKLDIEGMEAEGLRGARETLALCKPVLSVEIIKSDQALLRGMLEALGYRCFPAWLNLVAVHEDDPVLAHISHHDGATMLSL